MVTFAQAQERAEEWINGDVPSYQHREVRVREFDLGFVVWAEDRAEGPRSDGGAQRLVIARDSGEATLWPSLPVGEVIRRYEETYGREDGVEDAGGAPAASRVDLNQTSFLLTPPEWLQDAADKLGIGGDGAGVSSGARDGGPDGAGAGSSAGSGAGSGAAPGVPAGARPWTGTDTNGGEDLSVALPETVFSAPVSGGGGSGTEEGASSALEGSEVVEVSEGVDVQEVSEISDVSDSRTARISGGARGVAPSGASSYGYPQGAGAAGEGEGGPGPGVTPPSPAAPGPSSYGYPQAAGASGAGAPPPPPGASSYGYPQAPGGAGAPQPPGVPGAPGAPGPAPSAGDIADVATSKLAPPSRGAQAGGPTPPPPPGPPGVPGAQPGGGYVPTQFVSAPGVEGPSGSGAPQPPGAPSAPGGAPTPPPPGAPGMPNSSGGPGYPGVPGGSGAPQPLGAPGAPSAPSAPQPPGAPGVPRAAPGAVHHAETMLSSPPAGGPGMPPPPQAPGSPGAPRTPGSFSAPGAPGVPAATPGAPQPMPPGTMPPPPPGAVPSPGPVPPPGQPAPGQPPSGQPMSGQSAPGQSAPKQPVPGQSLSGQPMPGPSAPGQPAPGQPVSGQSLSGQPLAGHPAPGQPAPGQGLSGQPMSGQSVPGQPAPAQSSPGQPVPGQPPAYGYPQQAQPTVGPGYQAVLRYRAQDGSEQQLIRRSAPGTPHPEWQIFHELRGMNVPPDQVLELHTELESCELPGAYCARMIREQWPQARIASIAPYGTDHASRQQGMQQLLAHQGELHQVADGPARPAPVRAPLPPVQAAPPIPPEGVAQELAGAFGPGIFRFEQAAVSRQGVPPVVAHSLVVAGLPLDMGPFFWAQAQPGRPVPTLAELAAERGVQPASDAGSYLVMGSDFGKAICVQYGTANIVAVPVEAGPGGAPVPPQFVNTGLPEFQRCLALLGRMWRLRFGLNQEQAGRWTVDFQAQLASLDPAALGSPESWWSVLLEQMWDGLL
ncbi:SUKH-4 family immunity protein [Streptomyces doebereineriae]|uniref:SUKH-4 family immunity protein n=1 Tax=Streptomyces doebereineriae TaxID=3075528 RepID=A0ABU2VQU6_9ACTN|nr:SUKH-4 family immunity protein [Streptomyces sp. DSM 41640]MDT0487987.1 SUKH-4 family immunity protein [Streptomyces sp. DSM 41640]